MTTLSVLSVLWAVITTAFVSLMMYRAALANKETDQLFLNDEDTVSSTHLENDRVVRRLNFLAPLCKGTAGATVVLSLAIFGIWVSHLITPGV